VSAAAAISLAMGVLLLVSIVALVDASHAPRRWRIAPALLCCATAFWLADRTLASADMAVTLAQLPIKAYVPALVVLAMAATLAGLLWRLRAKPRPSDSRQPSSTKGGYIPPAKILPPLRGGAGHR
jgi:hypothetical protein